MPKSKPEPFPDVDLPRTQTVGVAEHEILLSFNGDDQAVAFAEWWYEKGTFAFNKWMQKREIEN
jgi:hypothetical protein